MDCQCFLRRHKDVQSGIAQSGFANFTSPATIPVACRSGSLNRTLMVRQNQIAASGKSAGRPGLASCSAIHVIPLSSQINKDPRRCRETVQKDRIAVRDFPRGIAFEEMSV